MIELLIKAYFVHSINTTAVTNKIISQPTFSTTQITAWPEMTNNIEKPFIPAASTLVLDLNTGKTLFQKDPDDKLLIASLTKIMTAMIVIENNNLNTVVRVPDQASKINGSKMWLASGELISIKQLLHGLLINSANDAAYALAITTQGSVDNFVEKMNQKAKELGMTKTNFTNPAGFDNSKNYSTATDMALLTRHALKNNEFKSIVGTRVEKFKSVSGVPHKLVNTNNFLHRRNGDTEIIGVKTGTTKEAGENLITLARDKNGHEILTIVLDAGQRYTETNKLISWIFNAFQWK